MNKHLLVKFCVAALSLMAGTTCFAEVTPELKVEKEDAMANAIAFAGENKVTANSTADNSAQNEEANTSIGYQDGRLTVNGLQSEQDFHTLSVFSLKGCCIMHTEINKWNPFVDIDLPSGRYVVKLDGKTSWLISK